MKKKETVSIKKPFDKIGRSRVIIENVTPIVEGGLYPAKRIASEWVPVQADVFTDGHDDVRAVLMYRKKGGRKWNEITMKPIGNDRFEGFFQLEDMGYYEFTVRGFIDHPLSWLHSYKKRLTEQDPKELEVQVQILENFLFEISRRNTKAKAACKKALAALATPERLQKAASIEIEEILNQYPLEDHVTSFEKTLEIVAHRKRAGFSSWYSFFPRSAAPQGKEHGTLKDCEALLPRIKEMGFDIVYFPPIHPIGHQFRKGKNNTLDTKSGEPGCPYATGNELGGHKAILPELGTLADFKRLIKKMTELDLEIAMDFAIQCSPDHPYVKEHPQWFKWRPDGTVQYAENPPKKYQDVLPLDYENEDWKNMWAELKSILEYWIEQGVKIFRVDNPHTKSFVFWQWCMQEIESKYPEVIFLSEAFTRPRIMENLAKKGFHQSYTYFTWRNSKAELMQYMHDLTATPMKEYFRPNFWPNTHDINPYITQSGHEPQFILRYFLAATLSSNYGIFGPSYELMVNAALPGKEEYLDSEKYEVRHWDWNHRNKLMHVIALVNKYRNENAAMHFTNNYTSVHTEHDQIMAWLKVYGDNRIICVANLDAYNRQSTQIHVPLSLIGKHEGQAYVVHDLLTGEKYTWYGSRNFVDLDPYKLPFHLFRIED
ncbi:MAG: alpha-1,4-glucan--maltose-1-phosphate maltosyltransferase [Flavobacteriales bacterium]|jgi:starch synthase (maltosyl-transferring)